MMTIDDAVAAIGGTQTARDYLQGIVEGSEAARDADRALRAACSYLRGSGVKYAMAAEEPELYAQAAFMLMADFTESTGNAPEGTRDAAYVGTRQILLQLRYDKRNKEAEA